MTGQYSFDGTTWTTTTTVQSDTLTALNADLTGLRVRSASASTITVTIVVDDSPLSTQNIITTTPLVLTIRLS